MAHIPDGILSLPVLGAGIALSGLGLGLALKRLDVPEIPKVALASGMFFCVSLISVPLGLSSTHLVLSALLGITLGLQVIPALFVGLLLQALLVGHGGILSLGVNLVNLAVPALLAGWIFRKLSPRFNASVLGGILAIAAILMTAGLISLCLLASNPDYAIAASAALLGHLPLGVVECVVTAAAVRLLMVRKPQLLGLSCAN